MKEKILADRYRLTEQIGMGGMAIVYRAVDLRTGHNVAVKVLRPEFNEDSEFISRFQREAEAASKMTHHNIVNLLDVGTEGACVWATSLTDEPISSSSRLLLTHLTDGTDTGTVFRDGRRIQIERWGRLPHLLRAGRAEVSLAVREGVWRVYALDAAGRRCGEVQAIRKDGRLAFWADVSLRPDDATFLYELTTGGDRRPQP